ncbi:MAG: hypothetical protein AMS17_16395 [Spirochaetes bacterium DG_61]|jgi:uroporphyrinogen decarboxylase|nr:MAG: hypothetical protein AMS17_16395 [Spirochaetes bacterium DG_61]
MTSVERVKNAIKGKKVDRIPVSFELVGETDLKEIYIKPPRDWHPKKYEPFVFDIDNYQPAMYCKKEDEWGVIWEYGGTVSASGIPVGHPLKNLKQLENYVFPDPYGEGRFEGFDKIIKDYPDKYLWATYILLLFERLYCLHGYNETLMDLLVDLDTIEVLLDKILDFQLNLIRNLGDSYRGKVHAFASTDDWGTNTTLIINPELWREVFKPRYARIVEEVHQQGMDFWFHSDGMIEEIIPDLIEIGVDVFNICDPQLLGIESFGKKFSGKSCFTMYIDIQKTAVEGTEEDIVKEAENLVKCWSNEYGSGVLAMDYRDMGSATNDTLARKKIALSSFKNAFEKKRLKQLK